MNQWAKENNNKQLRLKIHSGQNGHPLKKKANIKPPTLEYRSCKITLYSPDWE